MKKIMIDFDSKLLKRREQINCLIPDKLNDQSIILYLLHGFHGCNTNWIDYGGALRLCDKYHVIIVMPNAYNSWYLNQLNGYQYFDFIKDEVIENFKSFFNYDLDWYVAGCSMGGYGAMRLALSGGFKGLGLFSAVTDFSQMINKKDPILTPIDYLSFNDTADSLKQTPKEKLNIYQYCGLNDELYEMNIQSQKIIKSWANEYQYMTDNGGHEWLRWQEQLELFLEWVTKIKEQKYE